MEAEFVMITKESYNRIEILLNTIDSKLNAIIAEKPVEPTKPMSRLEVCKELGISTSTFDRKVNRNEIKYISITKNGHKRFDRNYILSLK